jgi:hypothetical protein
MRCVARLTDGSLRVPGPFLHGGAGVAEITLELERRVLLVAERLGGERRYGSE